jgi:hypothetical protein
MMSYPRDNTGYPPVGYGSGVAQAQQSLASAEAQNGLNGKGPPIGALRGACSALECLIAMMADGVSRTNVVADRVMGAETQGEAPQKPPMEKPPSELGELHLLIETAKRLATQQHQQLGRLMSL